MELVTIISSGPAYLVHCLTTSNPNGRSPIKVRFPVVEADSERPYEALRDFAHRFFIGGPAKLQVGTYKGETGDTIQYGHIHFPSSPRTSLFNVQGFNTVVVNPRDAYFSLKDEDRGHFAAMLWHRCGVRPSKRRSVGGNFARFGATTDDHLVGLITYTAQPETLGPVPPSEVLRMQEDNDDLTAG